MTIPTFRADDQTGLVAEGPMNFPSLLPSFAEIDAMRTENTALRSDLDDARKEVDKLTDLLKASGTHVANLSSAMCAYQVERDEFRDQAEEYRDRFDLACDETAEALTRVGELDDLVAEMKRDVEWMSKADR